jgi:NitT/TauT family transport system substrate-binding protein
MASPREADAEARWSMHRTTQPLDRPSRRRFVQTAAGLGLSVAGASLLAGCANQVAPFFPSSRGGQIETTQIRLAEIAGICVAPQYVAADLLRAEGFTDVQYVPVETANPHPALASGAIDISMAFVAPFIMQVDQDLPIVLLGGVHVGCYELFGSDGVRAIRDLKGKTVGIPGFNTGQYVFLASLLAYVGLDPRTDVTWVIHPPAESAQRLTDGQVDALIGFPPVPQELRAKKIGHVVVNSAQDRPWSQYFCCTLAANRNWVAQHPVAAKRALRAILKATDICAQEPERAAQVVVDGGFTASYPNAVQTMKEIPYDRWREYDPDDSVRFYALRLLEIGMIKSSPEQIIAQGVDWRFFNELKQELKA